MRAVVSVIDRCFPQVQKPVWALITIPEGFAVAVRSDDDVAKVSVLVMVPLSLQTGLETADGWAALLLSWYAFTVS